MNDERNKQWIKSDKSESSIEILGEVPVAKSREPCLTDLPRFVLSDSHEDNEKDFELRFIDYDWPNGIGEYQWALEEMKDVERLEVYAPMITDATWNLKQLCHNGLSGSQVVSLLRHGTPKHI